MVLILFTYGILVPKKEECKDTYWFLFVFLPVISLLIYEIGTRIYWFLGQSAPLPRVYGNWLGKLVYRKWITRSKKGGNVLVSKQQIDGVITNAPYLFCYAQKFNNKILQPIESKKMAFFKFIFSKRKFSFFIHFLTIVDSPLASQTSKAGKRSKKTMLNYIFEGGTRRVISIVFEFRRV